MEHPGRDDRLYVSYLFRIRDRALDPKILERDGPEILSKAIESGLLRSAEIMLLEMKVQERHRSREESLRTIIESRAWNLSVACDTPETIRNSLHILANAYKIYIPDLGSFMGSDSDKRSILQEFNTILFRAKISL